MASTPPDNATPMSASESWVDLSSTCTPLSGPDTPLRVTPVPFGGEQDYLRMLREAQKESSRASNKVSPISSAIMSLNSTTRNTPSASPKSPPNSPNPELADFSESFKHVYINSPDPASGRGQPVTASELIWDWNSRPNIPPREWKLAQTVVSRDASNWTTSSSSSSSSSSFGEKTTVFSKRVLYTIFITNLVSILIGAGIGIWLSKRSGSSDLVEVGI